MIRLRQTNWYTYQLGELPIYANCYISWFTVTFFGWNTSQSTNCKSMFQHSFPPLLSWSHLIRTNRYSYRWGDHMYPWYRQTATFHVFPLSLFGCKWIPVQQLTPNLCFNIPFHLCIHDLVLDEPIPALTTTIGNGASEYVMFSIWFRRSENLLRMDWLASESNLNCLWNSFWI